MDQLPNAHEAINTDEQLRDINSALNKATTTLHTIERMTNRQQDDRDLAEEAFKNAVEAKTSIEQAATLGMMSCITMYSLSPIPSSLIAYFI